MEAIAARLEAVTARLEALSAHGGGAAAAHGGAASGSAGGDSEALAAYDELINGPLKNFDDLSTKIGGEVHEQAALVVKAFHAQRAFLAVVAQSKDPKDANKLGELVKPTATLIAEVQDFREKNRSKRAVGDHLAALSEGIPALGWVVVPQKPTPHVTQAKESAEFYTNRVLKEYKDKDETQKNWARSFPALLVALAEFVKKYHTTGLTWNPKGGDASAAAPVHAPAPAAAAVAAATPTPTATPTSKPATPASSEGLFSALNRGEAVTGGLKKVDKSQMTHKNPELRAAGVVQAKEVTSKDLEKSKANIAGATSGGPPKVELAGNKWTVEFQKDNKNIELADTENKHVVYIYKCINSTVVVKGKVNQVTLDSCKKVAVVVESAISGVDIVNSQSCQVQILGKAPTVLIDKTDGLQLFLSKEGIDTEILSAKSSELNVVVPGKTESDDPVETSLPEQLKTQWNGKKFVTAILEHKA